MTRVAWVLGVLATATVVAAAAVWLRSSPGPADLRQVVLRGEGLSITVGEGWTLTGADEAVQYADRHGRVTARLRGPAVYGEGACPGASRAFVGFPTGSAAEPAAAHTALVARWAAAVAGGPALGVPPAAAGGGWLRTDVTLAVPDGPCAPDRARLTVVSTASARGTASVVLVRDLDVPGALSDEAAEEVLGSVAPLRSQLP